MSDSDDDYVPANKDRREQFISFTEIRIPVAAAAADGAIAPADGTAPTAPTEERYEFRTRIPRFLSLDRKRAMDGTIFIDDDAFEQPQRRSKTRKVRRGGSAPSGASDINYPDGCDSEMDRLTWSGFPEKDRAGVRNIMGIFDIGWSEATAAYASADRDVQVAIDTLLFEADISDSDSDDESHSPVPDSILDPVLAEPETKKEEKKEEEEKAPAPAERRADGPSAPNCVVCLGPLDFGGVVKLATTKCGHVFCRGCIIKWIEQRYACPVCRKPCGKADIRDLYF